MSTQKASEARTVPTGPRASTAQMLFGIGTGNAVEWFDWAIYATFASFISQALFSHTDPISAFMATLAIFAAGFVARPFGGFLFGMIGDRTGRKKAMVLSIGMASVGSLLIAITPSYESIGSWASVCLLLARLIQGIAHGGELPSTQTYLAEMAPASKRGFWSTLIYFSGTIGIMGGTLIGIILTSLLTKDQMAAYGWRIPFLLGAVFGLYTLVIRRKFSETQNFNEAQGHKSASEGLLRQVARNWRKALQVIGLTVGMTVAFYVWGVSTPAFGIKALGMDPTKALLAGLFANLAFILVLPLWGKLSDKIGRRPVLMIAALGTAVGHFPMSALMQASVEMLGLAMAVQLIFIAGAAAITPAVFAEMFPTAIRTTGVAVPYSIAVALFGGTAAYLQAGTNQWFGPGAGTLVFSAYSILLLLITAVAVWHLPETKGLNLESMD